MNIFIPTKEELESTVKKTVEELLKKELPTLLRKAQRKEWINTNELMELTGWSRRTIQYLRDKKRIPFHQEGKRILYKTDDIEDYLRNNRISPTE